MREFFRPSGRSVWTAKELATRDDWVFHWPRRSLEEIDSCLERVKARGVPWAGVTAADFPLETLGDGLPAIKAEIATGRGFIVLRGLPAGRYGLDDLQRIYWGIGQHFGIPQAQSHLGDKLGSIIDLTDEQPDIFRRRGYNSGGPQTVHTDSSDIVSMLSITMAKNGGASCLTSAHTVHNLMLDHCPGLLDVLYTGFHARGTDPDAAAGGIDLVSPHRVPVYNHAEGWLNGFFVDGYVRRTILAGNVVLTPVEEAAIQAFIAFANHPDIMLRMLLEPGDMQFLNNRTLFHGRAAFEDHPEKTRRRHLLRLWLTVPDWPRMAPEQDYHGAEVRQRWAANAEAKALKSA